jgi:hypothetical protein
MGKPQPIHESVDARYKEYSSAPRKRISHPKAANNNYPIAANINRQPSRFNRTKSSKKTIKQKLKKFKAFEIGWAIGVSLLWFYPVQLFFAFVFLIAFAAANTEGLIAWMTRDIALAFMGVSWMVEIVLGTIFLIYAIIVFSAARVPIFSNTAMLIILVLCIWGYFAPLLFFLPWVYVFIIAVVYIQK